MFRPITFIGWTISLAACGSLGHLDFRSNDSHTNDSGSSQIAGVEQTAVSESFGGTIQARNAALQGASVSITQGSLAVATDIYLEEGQSLTDDSDVESLGVASSDIQSSGVAVVIDSSVPTDAISAMTLQIPAPSASLAIAGGHLVVLAKVRKASEGSAYFLQIITDATVNGSNVEFKSNYFEVFQAVSVAAQITEPKEVRAQMPIIRKSSRDELAGTWAQPCAEASDADQTSFWESVQIVFSGSEFGFRVGHFAEQDSGCERPTLQLAFHGKYQVSDAGERSDVKAIDLMINRLVIRPIEQGIVNQLNVNKVCGLTTWVSGRAVDVSDSFGKAGCFEETHYRCPDAGRRLGRETTIYSIYAIDGDSLRVGNDGDENGECSEIGDTPERRPSELESTDRAYFRQ